METRDERPDPRSTPTHPTRSPLPSTRGDFPEFCTRRTSSGWTNIARQQSFVMNGNPGTPAYAPRPKDLSNPPENQSTPPKAHQQVETGPQVRNLDPCHRNSLEGVVGKHHGRGHTCCIAEHAAVNLRKFGCPIGARSMSSYSSKNAHLYRRIQLSRIRCHEVPSFFSEI